MKKIYALALVLMTAAALTTACQKEEAASVAPVEQIAPVVQSGAADEQTQIVLAAVVQADQAAPVVITSEPVAVAAEQAVVPVAAEQK